MENVSNLTEVKLTRVIDAPVALVFQAWSDPKWIAQWWGPGGFEAPSIEVDFRVGGNYLFCMRAPDGKEYWTTGTYTEIVPLKKISYTDSFADSKGNRVPPSFYNMPDLPEMQQVTLTFESISPNRTRLELRHEGVPAGTINEMTEASWAESMVKLESRVEADVDWPQRKPLVISRTFNASRSLVFAAMTEPKHLANWWGPAGMKLDVKKMDLRPGGIFHYSMDVPNGQTMYGRFVFREIIEPSKLVFIVSFCDAQAKVMRPPVSKTWPLELLNIMTLEERDGKTTMTLRGWPIHESDEERATFEAGFESMNKGFKGTYDKLEQYLATLN